MTHEEALDQAKQFGRYELIELIAVGGMGEIYLARMRGAANFEKRCVIKKMLPHLATEEEFVTKFIDEANIVVQLSHGNIVPVFDMGEHDGELYLAMDYVDGLDLRTLLEAQRAADQQMPVALAVHIVAEVCKGLGYAHRKVDDDGQPLGIVHRDLSPSNILVSREGEVKLVDFGIAKARGRTTKSITGRLQGKFGYMSPEQARGESLDARSDIFSAGVVLYQILTGVRPFEGQADLDTLERVRSHSPEPPSAHRDDVPEALDAIVLRALEKERDARFQSADALLEALMAFLADSGETVTAMALADEIAAAEPNVPQAMPRNARFEDLLDLEADRLLARDRNATQTSTLDTPSTPDAQSSVDDAAPPGTPSTEKPDEDGDGNSVPRNLGEADTLDATPGAPARPVGELGVAESGPVEVTSPRRSRLLAVAIVLLAAAIVAAAFLIDTDDENAETEAAQASEREPSVSVDPELPPADRRDIPDVGTDEVVLVIMPNEATVTVVTPPRGLARIDRSRQSGAHGYQLDGVDEAAFLLDAEGYDSCRVLLDVSAAPVAVDAEGCKSANVFALQDGHLVQATLRRSPPETLAGLAEDDVSEQPDDGNATTNAAAGSSDGTDVDETDASPGDADGTPGEPDDEPDDERRPAPRTSTAVVEMKHVPDDARLYVNGNPSTGAKIERPRGDDEVSLEVKAPGNRKVVPWQATFDPSRGDQVFDVAYGSLEVRIKPYSPTGRPRDMVQVADVWVDDHKITRKPDGPRIRGIRVPVGRARVRIAHESLAGADKIDVPAGGKVVQLVELAPK